MTTSPLRIGFIGAGANTRARHIPNLRAIAGVELAGVANRSPESTAAVAREFSIPKTFDSWQALVADPAIDAVVIGTWPDTHCELTCAALEAGKHVLCEARMARDLKEARRMLAASQARPDRVAMLVPSPYGLVCGPAVLELLAYNFIGTFREAVVFGADDQFHDYSKFLHWRQDRRRSGLNTMTLGILHETLMRWAPPVTRVFAQTQLFEPTRPNPDRDGDLVVTVPDSLQALTRHEGGGRGVYHFSSVELHGPGKQIHLYGSSGTIRVGFGPGEEERMWVGRHGQSQLTEYVIPADRRGRWQVEEDFVAAVRGERPVTHTTFEQGVAYMEFTEAVARSAADDVPCSLPLS